MAWEGYVKSKDGPMREHTIITNIDFVSGKLNEEKIREHDEKVNKFNEQHNTFFNNGELRGDHPYVYMVTVCLYADGNYVSPQTVSGVPELPKIDNDIN